MLCDEIKLENGGNIIFHCSTCGKGLVDILVTQPKAIDPLTKKIFEWKIRVNCCYCGDRSYVKTVYGKFHLQGFGKIKRDDPTDCVAETCIENTFDEKGVLIINTVKV